MSSRPPLRIESGGPRRRLLAILWPAFVMAGVLEALMFALVDPGELRWFGAGPVEGSRMAIYSLCFFAFWSVIAISAAITVLLEDPDAGASPWRR